MVKKACAELGIDIDLCDGTRYRAATALAEYYTKEDLRETGTILFRHLDSF